MTAWILVLVFIGFAAPLFVRTGRGLGILSAVVLAFSIYAGWGLLDGIENGATAIVAAGLFGLPLLGYWFGAFLKMLLLIQRRNRRLGQLK